MTPLERAAQAACKAAGYAWQTAHDRMMANPDDFPIDEEWMAATRAILEAIREPSSAMTHAAQSESHVAGDCEVDYHGIWASMIDAALSDLGSP